MMKLWTMACVAMSTGAGFCEVVQLSLHPEAVDSQLDAGTMYFTMTNHARIQESIGVDVAERSILREEDIIVRGLVRTDDGFKVQIEYERILFEQTKGDQDLIFDSNVPAHESIGLQWLEKFYRPVVGISLDLSLDSSGRIVAVDRFRVPNSPMMELEPELIGDWVGLLAVKARFEPLFVAMPGGTEIEIGASHTITRQTPVESLTKLADVEETFTLREVDDHSAMIGITGDVEYDFGLYRYDVDEAGIEGTTHWDRDLGVLKERTWVFDMTYSGQSHGLPMVVETRITKTIVRN